ncbi:MAG: hypothetical protein NTU81_02170 [Candidatus Nomurabacteria bacterium]|nr:hypothetical protein [Candidatus Nomurabacteria bacterium]
MKNIKIILFIFSFFILGTLSVSATTVSGVATVNVSIDLCPNDSGVQTTLPCSDGDYCPDVPGIQTALPCPDTTNKADLVASDPTSGIVVVNTPITFHSTITNQGNASSLVQFKNLFQTSTLPNGGGTITNHLTNLSPILTAGGTDDTSASLTFSTIGTHYIRACADKQSQGDANGVVAESNENNNCSNGWNAINVVEPVACYWGNPIYGVCTGCGADNSGGTQTVTQTQIGPLYGGAACTGTGISSQSCSCGIVDNTSDNAGVTIVALPAKIYKGKTSDLKWTSSVSSCNIKDGTGVTVLADTGSATSGTKNVRPLVTTLYTIFCPGGLEASATVKVIDLKIKEN